MASSSNSRTQRLLGLIKLAKEKQISEPDKWAERILIKEEAYEQLQAEMKEFEKQRQEFEKEREKAEKQREKAEKQREYERRKQRKITEEFKSYNYRIEVFQSNIKDYDERMRLCNIMADHYRARIEFIESQDLNDFASDEEDEEIKKSNTQVIQNVTEPVTSSLVSRNQEFEHPTWTPPVTSSPSLPVIRPPPIPECPLLNIEKQDCMSRVSNHNIRTLTNQAKISPDNSYYRDEEFKEDNYNIKQKEIKEDTNQTDLQENKKESIEQKNIITETNIEPDHKNRIDKTEPMTFDPSKSTCPDQTTTSSSPPTSTCPSLSETTCPTIPSTCQSPTTIDDSMPQDLNKATSASNVNNPSHNQDKFHHPEPELTKERYLQSSLRTDNVSYNQESYQSEQETEIRVSISDTSEKKKSVQPDFVTDTSFTHIQACESTKDCSTMNIKSQRIIHEHKKLRQFAQGNKVRLLLPDLSNKLFYKWQGPFDITRKISDLLYEININNYTKVFHVHMFEHFHESDEDIIVEHEHSVSLTTIPEEEETSSIPDLNVSLPVSHPIDSQRVITPNDITIQTLKDTVTFRDQDKLSTSVPDMFPVLNIDWYSSNNMNIDIKSESSNMNRDVNSAGSNIDNLCHHPPFTQWTNILQKGTNEPSQLCCIDQLNSNLLNHCSIGHSYTEHFTNITAQHQRVSHRKLSFGIGQFIFLPNSNATQSDIICVINTRWKQQLHKLKNLFFKFKKHTHYHVGNSEET